MKKIIAVLPGDGIGPEITKQAVLVLKKIAEIFGHEFEFAEGLIGASAIDLTSTPLPDATLDLCIKSDAILLGAIGDPKYDNDPKALIRPEQGILSLRKALGLYANIRPIFTFKSLLNKSPLKSELVNGVDFVVIRELISGIYFGKRGRNKKGNKAFDTATYTKEEITKVAKKAFELSESRRNKLTLVDKANVLETSRLWREIIQEIANDYPKVEVEYMFVDNAAQQIIKNPRSFDVILTENMFGDILTDEASVITGSLGMLPSASLGTKYALFEPIHGSFPRATGQNIANPIGTILSSAMMLDLRFGLKKESEAVFQAVEKVLDTGYGTGDITNDKILGTKELTSRIIETI